jgi:drug/metabolite transporter superfamily protein YnfA
METAQRTDCSCYDGGAFLTADRSITQPMKDLLNHFVAHRSGAFLLLAIAAFLEAYGDSCFQSALYRASGMSRALAFAGGAASLVAYGLVVNAPRWEFGKLLGIYVVLFFCVAQIIARVKFGQTPTLPILIGGAFICLGGVIISISG